MSEAERDPFRLEGKRLAIQILLGILLIGGAMLLLGAFYRAELEAFGVRLVERWGLSVVFLGVLVVDTSPVPLMSEPVLAVGVAGGLPLLGIGIAASLGSLLASFLGYLGGRGLARLGLTRRLFGEHTQRARVFVSRYGFWGIALAALTPLPFALCTWTAGTVRMRIFPFAMAVLFRIPKTAFYLWLVAETWRLGAL